MGFQFRKRLRIIQPQLARRIPFAWWRSWRDDLHQPARRAIRSYLQAITILSQAQKTQVQDTLTVFPATSRSEWRRAGRG